MDVAAGSVLVLDGEFEMVNTMYHDVSLLLAKHANVDVEAMKAQAAAGRDEVAERLSTNLGPPPQFRLIDCKSTSEQNRVVLVDGHARQDSYTAISHTWGEEIYGVFNCECACVCSSMVPRCCGEPCPGAAAHGERHSVVIGDILKMCERVKKAGSEFVWHDGVCIAQHNEKEVQETIRHMGWIYAHAADTVIFLDYVGKPMALLPLDKPYLTRWYRRVWTVQEALLARRRRYCIRMAPHFHETPPDFFNGPYSSVEEYYEAKLAYFSNNGYCESSTTMEDFEAKLAHCYEDDSCIAVIEEEQFWNQLISLYAQVLYLDKYLLIVLSKPRSNCDVLKVEKWFTGLHAWITHFKEQVFKFPSLSHVLTSCALFRESKHEGDRINSILGLAGITDFVAPKDGNFEASSIEFLKRADQELIPEVMFWVNASWTEDHACRRHTWLPRLSTPIFCDYYYPEKLWHVVENDQSFFVQVKTPCHRLIPIWAQFSCSILRLRTPEQLFRCVVLENGMLELTGPIIWSLAVQFTLTSEDNSGLPSMNVDNEHLHRNCNILSMDVAEARAVGTPGQATFAKASSTLLGRVRFPLDMGDMEFKEQILGRPVIEGRMVEKGSSFLAHLVFAQYRSPALIVQGEDLEAPVSKIGIFLAHSNFHWLIHERNLCCTTILSRLVIK